MQPELQLDIDAATKTINSLKSRTNQIQRTDAEIQRADIQKDMFWENQKNSTDKVMASLRFDVISLRKNLKNNIIDIEALIRDFRTKIKKEQFETVKARIDKWRLEEYLTRERLSELIKKELSNAN